MTTQKRCCKCKQEKPISEFYKNRTLKDGLTTACKPCHYQYRAHPTGQRKRVGDLTGKRFGQVLVIKQAESDKWKKKQWLCKCDCGNDKILVGNELVNGRSKSCGCRRRRLMTPSEYCNENYVLREYKTGAKRRGYTWALTRKEAVSLLTTKCHYCGCSPTRVKDQRPDVSKVFLHNGIDRKDPSEGYIPQNCVPCCTRCNYAKRDMTYQVFLDFIKIVFQTRIADNRQSSRSK